MRDAQIVLEGPIPEDGFGSRTTTNLYLSQESTFTGETETNSYDIPSLDDDESLLAPLGGNKSYRINGKATPARLIPEGYGDSGPDAIINWIYEIESLCMPYQGIGYILQDKEREETFNPQDDTQFLVEDVRWTHNSDEPMDVEWSISLQDTEGVQELQKRRQAYINDQKGRRDKPEEGTDDHQNTAGIRQDRIYNEENNITLGHVTKRYYERSVDINLQQILHDYDVPNYGLIESGVKGEFFIEGQLTERDVVDIGRTSVFISDELQGTDVTFQDAVSQREFSGAVSDAETTLSAGSSNILDYSITLDIGDVQT